MEESGCHWREREADGSSGMSASFQRVLYAENVMQIPNPCGPTCRNRTVPPCAFTICHTSLRPRPCSPPWVLETSASWFSASSRAASIPTPSSVTVQAHRPSSAPTLTEIWQPWGLWTMLLRIRLSSIRRSRAASPSVLAARPGCSSEIQSHTAPVGRC